MLVQSPNDPRHYQLVTLDNGLRVLLCQDASAQKTGVSLTVNVGHFDDPADREGLAHFLEHMLFLGSEQFPEPGEFSQFISQHGGNSNAWTGTEHSQFFFEVDESVANEAIARFADFMAKPLLSERYVNKERKAIEAEFRLKLKDDSRRIYQVHKSTCNPAHPFAKFSVGNKQTLKDSKQQTLAQAVREFHQQQYRGSVMCLTVVSKRSLAEQQSWLAAFSSIPKGDVKAAVTEPLYHFEHQQILLHITPHKTMHKLIASFALPGIESWYRHKNLSFLAHLLGYEGEHSLYSHLKDRGWINGISAGGGINGSNYKDFNVTFALTDEGVQHYRDIIEALFAYLSLCRSAECLEDLYHDKAKLSELAFLYQEASNSMQWANALSINMHHYQPADIIVGDYLMSGLDHEFWPVLQGYFRAENMRLTLIAPDLSTDQTAKWYDTPYSVFPLEPDWLKQLDSIDCPQPNMALPRINPYLQGEVALVEQPEAAALPQRIIDRTGYHFWFLADQQFAVPKGYCFINFWSPLLFNTPQNSALAKLYVELSLEVLSEQFYDAELAGLSFNFASTAQGLTLSTSGLSRGQLNLAIDLVKALRNLTFCPKRFAEYRKQLCRHYRNSHKSKPVSQLFSVLSHEVLPDNLPPSELAKVLEQQSFARFTEFCQQLYQALDITLFVHGNWRLGDAQAFEQQFADVFAAQNWCAAVGRPLNPLQGKGSATRVLNSNEPEFALVSYFQAIDDSLAQHSHYMLLNHLLASDYFHHLRTELQLGYLVGTGFAQLNQRPGVAVYVQSPNTPSEQLLNASQAFLSTFAERIRQLSPDDWQKHCHGLVSQLVEHDKSLRHQSQRFWSAIVNQDWQFDRHQQLATLIYQMAQDAYADWVSTVLAVDADSLHLLNVPNLWSQSQQTDQNFHVA